MSDPSVTYEADWGHPLKETSGPRPPYRSLFFLVGVIVGCAMALLFTGCAPSPTAPATSTDNTIAYPGHGHIIDANLHDWYLSLASDIYEDGRLVLSPNLEGMVFTGRAQRLVWQSPHALAYGVDDSQWWMYDGVRFVLWVQP